MRATALPGCILAATVSRKLESTPPEKAINVGPLPKRRDSKFCLFFSKIKL